MMKEEGQTVLHPQVPMRVLHRHVRLNKRHPALITECGEKVQRIFSIYDVHHETQVAVLNGWGLIVQQLLADHGEIPGFWTPTITRHVTLDLCRDNPKTTAYTCLLAFDQFLERHRILASDANHLREGILSIHSDALVHYGRLCPVPAPDEMH